MERWCREVAEMLCSGWRGVRGGREGGREGGTPPMKDVRYERTLGGELQTGWLVARGMAFKPVGYRADI